MSNEALFILAAVVDVIFVAFAAWRGRDWLYTAIGINLVLISAFGAKLFVVFGTITNIGNIFYACAFLGTHFLLERYGTRDAKRIVWFGVGIIGFFFSMSYIATQLVGAPVSETANTAITTVFDTSIRIVAASVLGYIFAQRVNTALYLWLVRKTNDRYLWLRSNAANTIAQLVDSVIFFSLAFTDLAGGLLLQSILSGWIIKTAVVLLGTPLLYLNTYLPRHKEL